MTTEEMIMNDMKDGDKCFSFTTRNPDPSIGTVEFWGEFGVNDIHIHETKFDHRDSQFYFKTKSEAINAMISRLEALRREQ